MKKTANWLYYIVFIGALWLLNRHFQAFMTVNGLLQGLLVGVVLAFLAKLIFKTVTKMIVTIIVVIGIIIFLVSSDFITLPGWLSQIFSIAEFFRG